MLAQDDSGKDYGIYKLNATTGEYKLNYDAIFVTFSDKNIKELPMNNVLDRIKINDGTLLQVKGKPTIAFDNGSGISPAEPIAPNKSVCPDPRSFCTFAPYFINGGVWFIF